MDTFLTFLITQFKNPELIIFLFISISANYLLMQKYFVSNEKLKYELLPLNIKIDNLTEIIDKIGENVEKITELFIKQKVSFQKDK